MPKINSVNKSKKPTVKKTTNTKSDVKKEECKNEARRRARKMALKIDYLKVNSYIPKTTNRSAFELMMVILAGVLVGFGVKYFIIPADVISAGVSGIALTITQIQNNSELFGILLIIINIPLFIFGMIKVGLRFSILSAVSIIATSLFTTFMPEWTFLADAKGSDRLIAVIIGQMITGSGVALLFKYGASSGGIDFITTYLSVKKKVSVAFYALIFNIVIVVVSIFIIKTHEQGGFKFDQVFSDKFYYTAIGLVTSKVTIERIYPKFRFMKLNITSDKYLELCQLLKDIKYPHAWTIVPVVGGFKNKERHMITIICSYIEINWTVDLVHWLDEDAFIYTSKVPKIFGRYTIRSAGDYYGKKRREDKKAKN